MMKKRFYIVIITLVLSLALLYLGYKTNYGNVSNIIYEIDEMPLSALEKKELMMKIENEFKTHFHGCSLNKIRYSESYSKEIADSMAKKSGYYEGIILLIDFSVEKDNIADGYLAGEKYEDWEWLLVKDSSDSKWKTKWSGCGYR